ncbi:MAG: hypothetical protein M1608_16740 [Candidatus Omnitrophica bacterium]|nr:hypothetical protein [Candidatus Omnitrophota bacterium]
MRNKFPTTLLFLLFCSSVISGCRSTYYAAYEKLVSISAIYLKETF